MPFNIIDSLNGAADGVLGSQFLFTVANSPIYTALVITIVVVVISLICTNLTFGGALAIVARTVFWTFVAVTLIMLLHDRIILHQAEEVQRSGNYTEFMNAAPRGIAENGAPLPPGVIPVGSAGRRQVTPENFAL